MQTAMEQVNARNRKLGFPAVEMGVSVHSGEVVVGNVGSEKRAKYGVVGRPVNVASRIESCSVGGQVLASERTLALVDVPVTTVRQFVVHPKGVVEPLTIFEVAGLGGAHALSLGVRASVLVPLVPPRDVGVEVQQGKASGEGFQAAALTALSRSDPALRCAGALGVFHSRHPMDNDNQATAVALYAAFHAHDIPGILDLLEDDVQWHAYGPDFALAIGTFIGKAGVDDFFAKLVGQDTGQQVDFMFMPLHYLVGDGTVHVIGFEEGTLTARVAKGTLTNKPFYNNFDHTLWFGASGKISRLPGDLPSDALGTELPAAAA